MRPLLALSLVGRQGIILTSILIDRPGKLVDLGLAVRRGQMCGVISDVVQQGNRALRVLNDVGGSARLLMLEDHVEPKHSDNEQRHEAERDQDWPAGQQHGPGIFVVHRAVPAKPGRYH